MSCIAPTSRGGPPGCFVTCCRISPIRLTCSSFAPTHTITPKSWYKCCRVPARSNGGASHVVPGKQRDFRGAKGLYRWVAKRRRVGKMLSAGAVRAETGTFEITASMITASERTFSMVWAGSIDRSSGESGSERHFCFAES